MGSQGARQGKGGGKALKPVGKAKAKGQPPVKGVDLKINKGEFAYEYFIQ